MHRWWEAVCLCAAPMGVRACKASMRSSHDKCNLMHSSQAHRRMALHSSSLLAALVLIVGGCMLVSSTHGCGQMQGKHEEQPWQVQSCAFIATVRPKRWRTDSFGMCLLRATLALMVGGCVLVGSTHGCRRVQGKHEKQPWQVQSCAFIATVRPKRWRTALFGMCLLRATLAYSCTNGGGLFAWDGAVGCRASMRSSHGKCNLVHSVVHWGMPMGQLPSEGKVRRTFLRASRNQVTSSMDSCI